METCISYTGERSFLSSDERKTINRVLKLKEQYPDEVRILAMPENNDGCIYVELSAKWVRISPPRRVEYSDEQRAEMAERMMKVRLKSGNGEDSEDDR